MVFISKDDYSYRQFYCSTYLTISFLYNLKQNVKSVAKKENMIKLKEIRLVIKRSNTSWWLVSIIKLLILKDSIYTSMSYFLKPPYSFSSFEGIRRPWPVPLPPLRPPPGPLNPLQGHPLLSRFRRKLCTCLILDLINRYVEIYLY